jgi:hypothetical protein
VSHDRRNCKSRLIYLASNIGSPWPSRQLAYGGLYVAFAPCGHNRILTPSQERAIHKFIESYLNHGLLPTKGVLLAAIIRVRQLENKTSSLELLVPEVVENTITAQNQD